MADLPHAWEVRHFSGSTRGSFVAKAPAPDLRDAIRTLYERRLLTKALPGIIMSRRFVHYDPVISEIFSEAGEAANKVLLSRFQGLDQEVR